MCNLTKTIRNTIDRLTRKMARDCKKALGKIDRETIRGLVWEQVPDIYVRTESVAGQIDPAIDEIIDDLLEKSIK